MPKILCGVDIGGTKLAAGLVAGDGTVTHYRSTTDHSCLDEACVMDRAAGLVRELCRDAGVGVDDLEGVGVGMTGHMRSRAGVCITTSNLKGFKNYPVAAEISRRLEGTRTILENDANCQAWAEHRFGAGAGYDDMIYITASTGIGAGIVLGGRLHRGQTGTAGEIGHTIIEPSSDVRCTCGNFGCFMSHACTLNLDQLVRKRSVRGRNTSIFGRTGERCPADTSRRIDGKALHSHAEKGDSLAMEVITEYADYMGILLYNVFQIFNPQAIILGGGLMNWGCGYFERMNDKFLALAGDMLYDPLAILKASIKESSGVIGAATLILES